MKNKYLAFLLAVLMSMVSSMVSAHDFEVDGIYYNITSSSSKTVEVTYRGSSYNSYSNRYTGSVTIPGSVTYDNKTYSVTSIGKDAFSDCDDLTSVTIGNSVISIGDWAFFDCSGLTSVTIGNSVTSIGSSTFEGCTGLTKAEFASIECLCNISFGTYANPLSYAHHLYIDGTEVTDLIIPNSVTSIGDYVFSGCSGLTSVTIPNSVTNIGNNPFSGCSGLETIVVNGGNTVYDSREGCNAIIETASNTLIRGCKNTIILNSVTSIGRSAFEKCSALTSVNIPNSVTSIDDWAFSGCSGLTSVTIGNSVTTIGDWAFSDCSGMTSVTIGSSVTNIGVSAFLGCGNLTSITIPNSVTSIGYEAFWYCGGLTSVTVGNSVTSIGGYAFEYCTKLTRINCRATTPPSCGSGCMSSVPEDCTIEVPVGCKSAYEAVSPWNSFYIVETEDPLEATTVTLAAEYGTFCSAKALDFTDVEGVKAYIASVFDTETGELTLTRVKKVKARTGLVLRGTPGQTYEIPEGTGTTVVANLLVGVTEDTELSPTDGNFTNFIMARNDAGNIGFFRVGGTSTLKGGKAYLQLPSDELSSEVKGFRMLFDDGDMSDNVETIHNEQFTIHNEAGAVYDLQGRRVAKPTKGIYIVNGKKTVIK